MLKNINNDHIIFKSFENNDSLITELSRCIKCDLLKSISEKKQSTLVLPGGNTPKTLFKKLSNLNLDWSKVSVLLTDERWVNLDMKESNERVLRKYLIQNYASSANIISLKTNHNKPSDAKKNINQRLLNIRRPLEVLVLGMGLDGHTASLFPLDINLKNVLSEKLSLVHCVESIDSITKRISLTCFFLQEARSRYLYITGEEKLNVLSNAINISNPIKMPICAFLNHPIKVFWCP